MQFLGVGVIFGLAEHARDHAALLRHAKAFLDAPLLDHARPPLRTPAPNPKR
jgi:hypothetical protein